MGFLLLVLSYVVYERLSVMHRQARLPEILTKLLSLPLNCNLVPEHPPPPPLKNGNLGRSWHFGFWLSRPPPPNWNLGRSWYFGFWLSRNNPSPNEIYADLGALGFDFPGFQVLMIGICGDYSLYPPRIPSSFPVDVLNFGIRRHQKTDLLFY